MAMRSDKIKMHPLIVRCFVAGLDFLSFFSVTAFNPSQNATRNYNHAVR